MLATITIRPGTLQDLEEVKSLGKQLLLYDFALDPTIDIDWLDKKDGKEFLLDRLSGKDGIVFVACGVNQKIVGYLVAGIVETDSYRKIQKVAELEEFFILEAYRGKKIGGELMKQFKLWAREMQLRKMQVVVGATNLPSVGFYKHEGFRDYDLVLEMDS